MTDITTDVNDEARSGVIAGLIAYVLWGVFPVYFKLVESVSPLEVFAHRIIWAVVFGGLIIFLRRQWRDVAVALRHRKMLLWLALAALMIAANWLTYIWAIQNDRIFETSLGYYINPLMYVVIGVFFFGDRLRKAQLAAIMLATIGVIVLTLSGGQIPYVALVLGVTFTCYGVIRKKVVIGAMPGLFIETLLLLPFVSVWMLWLIHSDSSMFVGGGFRITTLLILAGPVTVVPLLCFAIAARRLTLTTVGFMQFLAPTLQFFTGIYYGEELTAAHIVCFAFIWLAVAIFSVDALRASRKKPPQVAPAGA